MRNRDDWRDVRGGGGSYGTPSSPEGPAKLSKAQKKRARAQGRRPVWAPGLQLQRGARLL